jgi:hypothetical protein
VRLLIEVFLDEFEDRIDDSPILCHPALAVKFGVGVVLQSPRS